MALQSLTIRRATRRTGPQQTGERQRRKLGIPVLQGRSASRVGIQSGSVVSCLKLGGNLGWILQPGNMILKSIDDHDPQAVRTGAHEPGHLEPVRLHPADPGRPLRKTSEYLEYSQMNFSNR